MTDANTFEPAPGNRDVFKALGDPTRRRIVELLAEGEQSVEALVKQVPAPYGSVSQHLQVLLSASIVERRRQGRRRIYGLRLEAIEQMEGWLAGLKAKWLSALDSLDDFLERRS